MNHLRITTHKKEDTTPAFPDTDEKTPLLQFRHLAILEGGMSSGKASLAFEMIDPKTGRLYVAQLTNEIFKAAHAALLGAEARFKDDNAAMN